MAGLAPAPALNHGAERVGRQLTTPLLQCAQAAWEGLLVLLHADLAGCTLCNCTPDDCGVVGWING
jgi:hypothetical protein